MRMPADVVAFDAVAVIAKAGEDLFEPAKAFNIFYLVIILAIQSCLHGWPFDLRPIGKITVQIPENAAAAD